MKKALCILFALVLTVAVFSGCGDKVKSGDVLPYSVSEDGVFIYSITRAAEANSQVESAAKSLRSSLKKGYDCNIIILKDSVEDYDGNYEIIVGLTNRQESIDAYEQVKNSRPNNNHDFLIKVVGDKICIAATSDRMIEFACEWFAENFGKSEDDWNMLYPGYEFLYTPEGGSTVVNTVAGENVGAFTAVVPFTWSYLPGREVDLFAKNLDNLGYPITVNTDNKEEVQYEFLFGDTEREASKATEVSGDDYIIKVVGTKVIVKGGNDLSTQKAISVLNDMLKKSKEEGKGFALEDGCVLNGKYDASEKGAYTLNFDDEFNGSTLNTKIWSNYGTDFGGLDNPVSTKSSLGGSIYMALYTDTNYIKVTDGNLLQTTARINATDFAQCRISTLYSMVYRYGFMEIRMKMPEAPGCVSLWNNAAYIGSIKPAVGSIDRQAFTEVDLLENFGSTTSFHSNVHRWWEGMDSAGNSASMGHTSLDGDAAFNGTENSRNFTWRGKYEGDESTLVDDYHIYTFYWDSERMEFAFDGHRYCLFDYTTQNNSVSIHCMPNYIVMSNIMGSASYGTKWKEGMNEKTTSVTDYVRVYQTDAVTSQMRYGDGKKYDVNEYTGNLTYIYPEKRRSY